MKRLFYISHDARSLSIHAREIIRHLSDAGVKVLLFCPFRALAHLSRNDPCRAIWAGPGHASVGRPRHLFQIRLLLLLLRACRKQGRPDLYYCRQTYSSLVPILLARMLQIPYFAEVNGIVATKKSNGTTLTDAFKVGLEKLGLHLADVVIVPSVFLKRRVIRRYRIRPGKITVIPNGANGALFSPLPAGACSEGRSKAGAFAVGFVGSMGVWQGIDVLKTAILRVTSEDNGIRFVLVGDYTPDADHWRMAATGGAASVDIDRFIKRHGLESRVIYHGFVSYEATARYMQSCDVLLAPYSRCYSQFGGGSPMKLYAYLATGAAVIVSDLGELTDATALRRQEAAFLVPPDDEKALADAILTLQQDSDLRRRLGINGRNFVRSCRLWEQSARRIQEVYHHRFGISG
jgi:glycosyltransferase involved in cell wall biosynthesis